MNDACDQLIGELKELFRKREYEVVSQELADSRIVKMTSRKGKSSNITYFLVSGPNEVGKYLYSCHSSVAEAEDCARGGPTGESDVKDFLDGIEEE